MAGSSSSSDNEDGQSSPTAHLPYVAALKDSKYLKTVSWFHVWLLVTISMERICMKLCIELFDYRFHFNNASIKSNIQGWYDAGC